MGCGAGPQLQHGDEECGTDAGRPQTPGGEDRRRDPRGGQREL